MCYCGDENKKFTRRDFLSKTSLGLGAVALGGLINPTGLLGANSNPLVNGGGGILGSTHFPAKA